MNIEKQRLIDSAWRTWGPYVTNRQWATVREDYSADSSTWYYTTYETARSRAYRWGEDGIAGICDDKQFLCIYIALWNKKDKFLKERLFGLTNREGNHGEDVKELFYYLDNTPSHSYMKMLYKYPMVEFPYDKLRSENASRSRLEPEFEITDTGIFDQNKYFDVIVEYAKKTPDDIFIRITVCNYSNEHALLNIVPTLWFRNTWSWGDDNYKPVLSASDKFHININHRHLPDLMLYSRPPAEPVFCENETNTPLLFGKKKRGAFKDGINNYICNNDDKAIRRYSGTKAAYNFDVEIEPQDSYTVSLRLGPAGIADPFKDFNQVFKDRKKEADEFYEELQRHLKTPDEKLVQRQAFAGMLWNKQFYYYDMDVWLNGDDVNKVSASRKYGRNSKWSHLHHFDIISMPDKWEYPWYATWDLAFHCIPLGMLDAQFAKDQLVLLLREWYMDPYGKLPAYEWSFSDVNPPVHAWACMQVYKMDKERTGIGDTLFLERTFQKLLINFTWWVNRKDRFNNNVFEAGFLGLDNIGVFDRNNVPGGGILEQADGTAWMGMYCLNMLEMALELAQHNIAYEDLATKFFEHFTYIASSLNQISQDFPGSWDEEEGFFYDVLKMPNG